MAQLIYPTGIDTPAKKLEAVYSLIEQGRLAHNAQGAIARDNWDKLQGKWRVYARHFEVYMAPLFREKAKLALQILNAEIPLNERFKLPEEQMYQFIRDYLKPEIRPTTKARFDRLDTLKKLSVLSLEDLVIPDPYQDFTTYTEYNPGSYINVGSPDNYSIGNSGPDSNTGYVRKDFGAGYFGNFIHWTKTTFFTENVAGATYCCHGDWALTANAGSTTRNTMQSNTDGLFSGWYSQTSGSTRNKQIWDWENAQADSMDPGAPAVTFYTIINRNATDFKEYLYSDSGRTSLVATLALVVNATTYRYVFGCMSRGGTSSGWLVTGMYNYDLHLSGGYVPGGGPGPMGAAMALSSFGGRI